MLLRRSHLAISLVVVAALLPVLSQARDGGEYLPDAVNRHGLKPPLMFPAAGRIAPPISGKGSQALVPDIFAFIEESSVRMGKTAQLLLPPFRVASKLQDDRLPVAGSVAAGGLELFALAHHAGAPLCAVSLELLA